MTRGKRHHEDGKYCGSCTQLDDAGLERLLDAKHLTSLKLRGPAIKGATLDVVRRIPALESFTIEESPITADDLKKLKGLPLAELSVFRCLMINDEGLSILAGWKDLRQLQLRDLAIDGSCLVHLGDKRSLAVLQLAETGLGDAALEHLAGLKQLARLDLRQTQVTDAGLETLAKLPALEHLDLTDTSVTDDGVKKLTGKLPRCKVVR